MSFQNLELNKEYTKVRADGIDEWLWDDAFQRVMFLHGDKSIGIRWVEDYQGETRVHKDPHICSRFCLWFQTDIYCCGCCVEPKKNYLADVHLYDINRFVPPILPFMPLLAYNRRNFELRVTCKKENVKDMFKKLQRVAKDARLELRFSESVLWIDVSVECNKVNKVCTKLMKIINDEKLDHILHKGKFQPDEYQRNAIKLNF